MMHKPKGKIFFFSGPSGVGKGTLIDHLRKTHPEWVFPPSCTTRNPRPGEKNGETYFFISKEEFETRIKDGDFLEYAQVHGGNYYGTLREKLIAPVEMGKIVIREFDVQGFFLAKERLPRKYFVSIFIQPHEGIEVLIQRIKKRAPISDEEVFCRMESMKKEIEFSKIYDYQVLSIDNQPEELFHKVEAIIDKETAHES